MNSRVKIILVEDELIIAASIAQELQKSGFEVIGIATSAEQALAAISQSLPELVLMDIRIRGPVDGIEAAQQIPKSLGIPVIFMSAHADTKTLDRAKAAGAAGYLVKPIARGALVTAIQTALDNRQIENTSATQ
jgi:DNA-binding NarL/FixJ family response regulator